MSLPPPFLFSWTQTLWTIVREASCLDDLYRHLNLLEQAQSIQSLPLLHALSWPHPSPPAHESLSLPTESPLMDPSSSPSAFSPLVSFCQSWRAGQAPSHYLDLMHARFRAFQYALERQEVQWIIPFLLGQEQGPHCFLSWGPLRLHDTHFYWFKQALSIHHVSFFTLLTEHPLIASIQCAFHGFPSPQSDPSVHLSSPPSSPPRFDGHWWRASQWGALRWSALHNDFELFSWFLRHRHSLGLSLQDHQWEALKTCWNHARYDWIQSVLFDPQFSSLALKDPHWIAWIQDKPLLLQWQSALEHHHQFHHLLSPHLPPQELQDTQEGTGSSSSSRRL